METSGIGYLTQHPNSDVVVVESHWFEVSRSFGYPVVTTWVIRTVK